MSTLPWTGSVDFVKLAADLIRCASVTPKDDGAIDLLAFYLKELGFTCHVLDFAEKGTASIRNLYARLGTEGRNFCFAGHTDVVPPGRLDSWSVPPFDGVVTGGVLYGRGAADMKGSIACFVAAVAKFLAERGDEFGGSISLLITGDEEGVAINGTKKLLSWLTERGEKLDLCVVGEPTSARFLGDTVKIGRRGSLMGYLTVKGIQGHTAYPSLADNPVHHIVPMLQRLIADPLDEGTEHFQPSTLQLTTIDVGNTATNVIPAEARAAFNIRYNDRWTSETLTRFLHERLAATAHAYELTIEVSGESFLTPPGDVSTLLSTAIDKITGRKPELNTAGGTSDARFIHHHCPVAEFGLVGQTMHKIDERAPVADMAALTEIYRTTLDLFFPAA